MVKEATPFRVEGGGAIGEGGSDLMLDCFIISLRSGEETGAGRKADRIDWIFPLDMTYTLQKSGAPLPTLPGISVTLNLPGQEKGFLRSKKPFWEMIKPQNAISSREKVEKLT